MPQDTKKKSKEKTLNIEEKQDVDVNDSGKKEKPSSVQNGKVVNLAKLRSSEPVLSMKVQDHVPQYKPIYEANLGTIHYNPKTKCYEAHAVSKHGRMLVLQDPEAGADNPVKYVSQPPRNVYIPRGKRGELDGDEKETSDTHKETSTVSTKSNNSGIFEKSLDISATVEGREIKE